MAVSSKGRIAELRKWQKDRDATPERTRVLWHSSSSSSEHHPNPNKQQLQLISNGNGIASSSSSSSQRKVAAVVYYLCRNGQLEHPHFMEVPLSSTDGLYLRDVINRLDLLRGKGMASLYSWSAKRSYKNGFVWHDLAENDFIYPAHGHEYVLKGSELLDSSIVCPSKSLLETTPSSRPLKSPEIQKQLTTTQPSSGDSEFPVFARRRNQSWSSIDVSEYKVYRAESFSESSRRLAADASTQTDDKRRRRRPVKQEEEIEELREEESKKPEASREEIEISPPPSDSSPETLETLMKADGRLILSSGSGNEENLNRTVENCGRVKASSVLMQLISCGSISFRDCGATAVKEQASSLPGQQKGKLPREAGAFRGIQDFARLKLEDKEYFSGSLVETKKEEVPPLKRSNSYTEDRSSQLQLAEKEIGGVRTKCIPRKSKAIPTKKDGSINVSGEDDTGSAISKGFAAPPQVENEAH